MRVSTLLPKVVLHHLVQASNELQLDQYQIYLVLVSITFHPHRISFLGEHFLIELVQEVCPKYWTC